MPNRLAPLTVRPVRAFSDNYIWLIESPTAAGQVIAVDPGEAAPVIAELERQGLSLAAILLTHHHPDHIGGVPQLLERWAVPVVGPDDSRIATRSRTLRDQERCELPDLGLGFEILAVPGHTVSHIAFWGHGALFCGDTLFSAGCGRMFEGTPTQMNASLNRLRALPPDTRMFCGHEYTAANLKFALQVEPANTAARDYQTEVERVRAAGHPSLPSTLALEIKVNPFLRCDQPGVAAAAAAHAGRPLPDAAQVFGVLRAWKDTFPLADVTPMAALARILSLSCMGLILAACAHRPAAAPLREPVVIAPPSSTDAAVAAPDTADGSSAPPSLTMPREWQHHNGEDYDDLFDRMRAGFAFDEVQEPSVDIQLAWFKHNPDYMERVFQRSQRYMYHIVTEVEARGMPLEFALLPVVESAFEPFAYSSSRAAGLWQFIPGTGVRFGLKQNWWFDGRRDVIESTRAALDYLQALHDQFDGDWLLAIAAYNVGENTVQRELDYNRAHGKPADFWHLILPAETRAYVPKLLAMKRLMAEPERYGLEFAAIPNEPYFAVIDTGSQIDLKIAAQLAGTSYDELVALNPGYNRWATDPEGPHRMLVPIDNADAFDAALKSLGPDDRVRFAVHEVGRKETLAMIAKQSGTSAAVIAKVNDLKGNQVSVGQSLKIPQVSGDLPDKVLLAAQRVDRPETDRGRGHPIVYRVRSGETLSSIARRHGMPVSTLARLNNIGAGESLIKGQRLLIKASARRHRDEGVASGRRVVYTVRNGDTMFSISRQFQVSVPQLKSWNGLNKRHQIRAGQRLVMYVDAGRRTQG